MKGFEDAENRRRWAGLYGILGAKSRVEARAVVRRILAHEQRVLDTKRDIEVHRDDCHTFRSQALAVCGALCLPGILQPQKLARFTGFSLVCHALGDRNERAVDGLSSVLKACLKQRQDLCCKFASLKQRQEILAERLRRIKAMEQVSVQASEADEIEELRSYSLWRTHYRQ